MICVRLMGGLGNQMFQYSLGRHLALKNGTELFLDTTYFDYIPKNLKSFVKRDYHLDIFNIKSKILESENMDCFPYYNKKYTHQLKHFTKRFLNLYKYIDNYDILLENKPFYFDNEILKSGPNSYLIGYWQNEKYFKDIPQYIRQDFTFKNTFAGNITELAQEISSSNSICLNIRRGDFINNPTHGFVGMEYISQAVSHLKKNIDISKIYVFSDEIDWCKENLRFDSPNYFVSHSYAGDRFSSYLYLMTKCRHFIIPNSTFGWWAAWLSENPEKMIIAPKQWVNVPGLDASGIIPEGWMTM